MEQVFVHRTTRRVVGQTIVRPTGFVVLSIRSTGNDPSKFEVRHNSIRPTVRRHFSRFSVPTAYRRVSKIRHVVHCLTELTVVVHIDKPLVAPIRSIVVRTATVVTVPVFDARDIFTKRTEPKALAREKSSVNIRL